MTTHTAQTATINPERATRMKTLVRIAALLAAAAAFALLGLSAGCSSLGRTAAGIAGLVAPEHKATADNLYALLRDDQLASSLDVEVALEDKEGRIYRKADLTPVVLTSRRAYTWDSLPTGAWDRFLGGAPDRPALAAQRKALADALAAVPSTPPAEEKKK